MEVFMMGASTWVSDCSGGSPGPLVSVATR
jgi:hypothetical protein